MSFRGSSWKLCVSVFPGFHGSLRLRLPRSMEVDELPWKFMEVRGSSWKPPWKLFGVIQQRLPLLLPYASTNFHGASMSFHQLPWKPSPWKLGNMSKSVADPNAASSVCRGKYRENQANNCQPSRNPSERVAWKLIVQKRKPLSGGFVGVAGVSWKLYFLCGEIAQPPNG